MDLGIVIGLVIAFASVIATVILDGGHLGAFVNLSATLIILGGTIGATMVHTSLKEMLRVPTLIKKALFGGDHTEPESIISPLVQFAQKARREGVLALQQEVSRENIHPFLIRGLQLVIDGADEDSVRNILDTEIGSMGDRHRSGQELFTTMGGYAPTMGLIGAVLGLIAVLGSLGEGGAGSLGNGIATAFIATLYGVFFANILFLPLAGNLKAKSDEELFLYKVMVEGILGIQAGQNPRMLQQKLRSFFPALEEGKAKKPVSFQRVIVQTTDR